ncbi:MAG TPA: ERAP1-like C-terminal domain-containing protein, partial [Polyangiales bacterium]|nr:ERAP1-like C-terminal domain-containing protein [Polyangiales bacterium]
FVEASLSDPTPQERRRFRMALGDVRDPALVRRVLELCLDDKIPTQDVALVLARLLGNRHAQLEAWSFIKARWPALRERMPAMLASRLIEATPALREENLRKDVMQFFKKNPLPTAARALRQADERFRLNAAFRRRAAPALARFLRAFPV